MSALAPFTYAGSVYAPVRVEVLLDAIGALKNLVEREPGNLTAQFALGALGVYLPPLIYAPRRVPAFTERTT